MASTAKPGAWVPGPADPKLEHRALHVWRAELDHVDPNLAGGALSQDERARADRMLGNREQQRWSAARAVLRTLLARYLDLDPAALSFHLGAHGKPALDPPAISFNLSHSGGLALYAIAHNPVGVDVELDSGRLNPLAIARRVLGEHEAARLQALEPGLRRREFLRAWTRHEATTKCLGLPLLGNEARPRTPPWILDLDLTDTAAAAVALDGPPPELFLWEWPPAPA